MAKGNVTWVISSAPMTDESYREEEEIEGSSNRGFGFVFGGFFLLVGLFSLPFGGGVKWWSMLVAGAFAAIALIAPNILAPLNRAWTRFGLLIHAIVNPFVLGVMFFFVITPMGLIMRLFGKDPLRLSPDRDTATYWIDRDPPGPPPESLENQF